ncbi:MAG: type II toxin-antitoxin system RelE family toxin [Candidatus Sericytochromatia bacterium]
MAWDYEFKPSASKSLDKLEAPARNQIVGAIERLTEELTSQGRPVLSAVAKLQGTGDKYRLRVGTWRIIFKFEADRLVVLVLNLGHRREIYRD